MSSYLYIRSVYSLLSSMNKVEDIVSYGKKLGYDSLALVDKNVLAGAMSFKKACETNNIKPIFGLEFDIKIEDIVHSMILYAKNDLGFKNLMSLSSYISTNDDKIIDIDTLNKYRENNVLCLFSDDMPLTSSIDKNINIEETLNKQKELFKEYIVALVDHNSAINKSRDITIKELLIKNKIGYISVNRTYYLNAEDNQAYEVLKCIRDKKTINDYTSEDDSGRYFIGINEFKKLYSEDEINNNEKFSSILDVKLEYKTSLPEYKNKNNIPSKDYLISLCKEGLKRRLKNKINDNYIKRLEYELSVITKMRFEDYFLIVYDFILFAKKSGIMVGPARGSAGGSLVAYCLGITEIDPLKYGLIFERFLNPERISMPDIDTDFPDDRRDEVIEYVKNKYGEDHVAHIITYGTLKAKQVIRDVGRVLNYSTSEIDSISKLIPNTLNITLRQAYEESPIFKQKIESEAKYRKLFSYALKLEGNPRHESTHAAGIVMSSKPLSDVIPVIKIESDINSTQYTMEHLEQMGLIKMDFLGLRNLGIIAEIVDDINLEESFNIKDIPLDDPKTYELIDNVNVLGVFQLESSGMQNLIRKMKPKTFEEIGMTIALFRPGPMENIPLFLENRANPNKINYLHPDLKPILQETYGVIVYQEQIMNIARRMAKFSYGKADVLRKAMSKKKAAELEKLYPEFVEGCINNGYSKDLANKVYELIMKFANYGFNKSHSIGYGLLAYQMAYLKAKYPLYFYKALLNGVIGAETKTYDYLSECINIGQKVHGISLNNSDTKFIIKDKSIIMPFTICKDVGFVSAIKIIEERNENGKFKDYVEAVTRLVRKGVDKNVIENLIYAGGFDEFKHSRHTMINALENVLMYANAHKQEISFFDSDDAPLIEELKDDNMVLADNEKKVLGFYFTFNPITAIKKKYNVTCDNLYNVANSVGYVKGFGLIKRVKTLKTKKGEMMAFVDIIDDKGELSLAVMPNIYRLHQTNISKDNEIVITPIEEIKKGDHLLIKPGESIPQDGIVLEGISSVDESLITGESIPASKTKDSLVIGGTVNIDGELVIEVNKVSTQTTLSKIVSLTKKATMSKIAIERFADNIAKYFVYIVISISLITLIIWLIASKDIELSLNFALSVLVISCPCALGLATPSAIAMACNTSSKNGVLIKNPEILEIAYKIKNIVLDKTGTLTENKLEIVKAIEYKDDFKYVIASLEADSNHPIANAIKESYKDKKITFDSIIQVSGEGIIGKVNKDEYYAGNKILLSKHNIKLDNQTQFAIENNYSYIGVGKNNELLGIIYLQDKIKKESYKAIDNLKSRNINLTMATGDNEIVASSVSKELGINNYLANVKPQDKQDIIIKNKESGITAMVGDGINDAVALSTADIAITLADGTDIANASSDVSLITNNLNDINFLIDLSRKTMRIIKQNLFWALGYNSIFIPLAAGVFYNKYGLQLNPMIGSITMSISSIVVILNALRISRMKKEN